MPLALSPHVRARIRQRGIHPAAIDLLLGYGRERHVHDRGREIVFFDKAAGRRPARANPDLAREAARLCRTYAILGAGRGAITVGHRYRRLPR